jgi:hypothetical protein
MVCLSQRSPGQLTLGTTASRSPLLPSFGVLPAKRHSSTDQKRMASLVTATLVFAASTAVVLLLAHRFSLPGAPAAQPIGFPACKAEVMLLSNLHPAAGAAALLTE